MIDGLSLMEEQFLAQVYPCLNGLPLVGGSAGDSLEFNETRMYYEGQFHPIKGNSFLGHG